MVCGGSAFVVMSFDFITCAGNAWWWISPDGNLTRFDGNERMLMKNVFLCTYKRRRVFLCASGVRLYFFRFIHGPGFCAHVRTRSSRAASPQDALAAAVLDTALLCR